MLDLSSLAACLDLNYRKIYFSNQNKYLSLELLEIKKIKTKVILIMQLDKVKILCNIRLDLTCSKYYYKQYT